MRVSSVRNGFALKCWVNDEVSPVVDGGEKKRVSGNGGGEW
jgi:hypothetical protein